MYFNVFLCKSFVKAVFTSEVMQFANKRYFQTHTLISDFSKFSLKGMIIVQDSIQLLFHNMTT